MVVLTEDGDYIQCQRDEEYEYHMAVSDIAGFVSKYGLSKVTDDIVNFLVSSDVRNYNE